MARASHTAFTRPKSLAFSWMSSRWAAISGMSSRFTACSFGLVSAPVRLKKTEPTRSMNCPDSSSATMVFWKVGAAFASAMRATSAFWRAIPSLKAGRK